MKSIIRTLIVAALGTALSGVAFAQSSGAGSSNPSNEDATTAPGGDRTQPGTSGTTDRPGLERPAVESTNPNPNSGPAQDREMNRNDSAVNGEVEPKKKRSLWDRITGRNKSTEAETAPTDTDASDRRRDRENDR